MQENLPASYAILFPKLKIMSKQYVLKDVVEECRREYKLNKHFKSGCWLPAADIHRRFVKHPNPEDSPGVYWQYTSGKNDINLSVIIPTLDAYRGGYFPKLLAQFESQNYPNFEVIVVKGDPRQGRAINIGAAIAKGKYLMTLDDDTSLPDPATFQKLIAVMDAHPAIGMAGGNNVIPEDASRFVRRVMEQIPRRSWTPVAAITDSDLAEHPLLVMRKEVFIAVGGENEYLLRGLDPYLRHEFRKAGYRVVVVPDVVYSHLPPASMNRLIRQFYRNGKMAAFCNKFYPQWVIETPEDHVKNFIARRPFWYRVARHVVNMVNKLQKRHWIYLIVTLGYAFGFIWGYLVYRDEMQA